MMAISLTSQLIALREDGCMYIVQKEMLTYPPRYYATKFHVSTWNYATVHCHAKIKYTDEKNEIWSKFVEMVPFMRGLGHITGKQWWIGSN